jgi:hypothetical protein
MAHDTLKPVSEGAVHDARAGLKLKGGEGAAGSKRIFD